MPCERHLSQIEDVYNSDGMVALSGGRRFTGRQAEEYLRYWRGMWEKDGIGYHCVSPIDAPNRIVGFVGLNYFDSEPEGWLNQFFCLSSNVWGKGYAREASRACWHSEFCSVGAVAVYARTGAWNSRARRACSGLEMREVPSSDPKSAMYVMHRDRYLSVVSQRFRDEIGALIASNDSIPW